MFVPCLASDVCAEIVVTLRAANRSHDGLSQSFAGSDIDEDTYVVVAADDPDVLDGRELWMEVVDLAIELFEVFSRQASPDGTSGIIRLPGWDPCL